MKTSVGPGSVMVGVDGSSGSSTAVVWAATYAAAHRRPLTIVHGVGSPVVTDFAIDLDEARHGLLAVGSGVTDDALGLAQAVSADLDISVHLELGEPRALLVDAAADAHLLVLGSRGHGALLSLLLGSVSVAVAAHASCPVVVVRPSRHDEPRRPVVVGVDGTADSVDALTFAFELADEQHRPLEVVHALGEDWLFSVPEARGVATPDEERTDWQLLLAESVAGYAEKFPDVAFSSRAVRGSASAALVAAAQHASTVVIGASGRSGLATGLLGSVSRWVVEHAHCTVVVVRGGRT